MGETDQDEAKVTLAGAADAFLAKGPLRGRTVLLVHPAWHSCGSHQVFVSQARAYRALGARVLSLAVADAPGANEGSRAHKAYFAATEDLECDARFYTGMSLISVLKPSFLQAVKGWLHGNFAGILVASTELAPIPAALAATARIDLIHCNHFFCMPAALSLRRGGPCPVLLETHDLQARQYALRNEVGWTLPPAAAFEEMLAIEQAAMRTADVLVHLNDEEFRIFQKMLPDQRHALLYPAVAPIEAPARGTPSGLILVASANHANFLSTVWFLEKVLPAAPEVPVRIIGNIDREIRARAPKLWRQHEALFCGRIDDLDAAYGEAAGVLLPTIEGHGVSIKTIEAMSSGAPLIATPLAFRGMGLDPVEFGNVALALKAEDFAAAMRRACEAPPPQGIVLAHGRSGSDTRKAYERIFAPEAYQEALRALVTPLLPAGP
ncbi:glycosyltransferase [Methylocapsa palsarum]|nr:glycosyltransferase [Methylocapsa palsarum]